jgi:hypothetical protein
MYQIFNSSRRAAEVWNPIEKFLVPLENYRYIHASEAAKKK